MSFTFGIDIGKGVLAIDIYKFIRAKQNDIDGVAMQPRSREYTWASNTFNRENTGQM